MEENKNMEMACTEENQANETCETESTGGGWIAKAVGVAAVGAAVWVAHKCKGKIEKHNIKTLEKKGYKVIKPEPEPAEVVDGEMVSEENVPEEAE